MGVRIGIIGYGLAGRLFHTPLVRATEGLDLVAVSRSRGQQLPAGVRAASPEELIADPAIDLIIVASPNDSHFPLAQAAIESGKHLVIDKPMCVSSEEARKLIDAAHRYDRLLIPFHNRRWDSDFLTVRKLLHSGALGQILLFEAHWDRFRPQVADRWRESAKPGSGLLYDLGPHLIDQVLLLFGPPGRVHGDVAAQREGAQADDYFRVTLHYGSKRVILSASSLVARPRPRFAIHGTGGSFVKFGLDPQEDRLRAGKDPQAPDFGIEDPAIFGTLTRPDGCDTIVTSECGDWLGFYRGVAAAITKGAPPPVDPVEALAGLSIIEAAREGIAC